MLGFGALIRSGVAKLVSLGVVSVAAYSGYQAYQTEPGQLDGERLKAAAKMAERTTAALAELDLNWTGKYVAVGKLSGSGGDYFREHLEKAVGDVTNATVVTDSFIRRVSDAAMDSAEQLNLIDAATADAWKANPVDSLDAALRAGESAGLDYVVYGRVEDLRALPEDTYCRLHVGIADIAAGGALWAHTFEDGRVVPAGGGPPAVTSPVAGVKWWWRMAGWLVVVLAIPVLTSGLWMGVLDRESNALNAVCLVALTALAGVLAWSLMGFSAGSFVRKFFIVTGVLFAMLYNFLVLNALERTRFERKYPLP